MPLKWKRKAEAMIKLTKKAIEYQNYSTHLGEPYRFPVFHRECLQEAIMEAPRVDLAGEEGFEKDLGVSVAGAVGSQGRAS